MERKDWKDYDFAQTNINFYVTKPLTMEETLETTKPEAITSVLVVIPSSQLLSGASLTSQHSRKWFAF